MAGREEHMELALKEARRGLGRTRPNPMVGCVIAKGKNVIAVGHHVRAGAAHAEIAALKRAGTKAKGADVYVTLEPCDHTGRTGPCTEALIKAGVKRVFVGMRDPNPIVNGRGIRRLRKAKIQVEVGMLAASCRQLNEAFTHYVTHGEPFVELKLAQSLDGKVATRTGESKWITSEASRREGHRLRSRCDGIIVGSGTVLADDPELTCRIRGGVDPVRIVLDTRGRTPPNARVIRAAKTSKAPTWIFVGKSVPERKVNALTKAGAEVIRVGLRKGHVSLKEVMKILASRDLLSVLVEGGPTTAGSFVEQRYVNRLHAFIAPMLIGGKKALGSVGSQGADKLANGVRLCGVTVDELGDDLWVRGYLKVSR